MDLRLRSHKTGALPREVSNSQFKNGLVKIPFKLTLSVYGDYQAMINKTTALPTDLAPL